MLKLIIKSKENEKLQKKKILKKRVEILKILIDRVWTTIGFILLAVLTIMFSEEVEINLFILRNICYIYFYSMFLLLILYWFTKWRIKVGDKN